MPQHSRSWNINDTNEKPAETNGNGTPGARGQRRTRLSTQDRFIDWFQSVAPYIHAFRGKTFVIAFGGEVVADGRFFDLTHDLNLLAALGVKLVLVHGTRPQIEAQLKERKQRSRLSAGGNMPVHLLRRPLEVGGGP